MKAIIYHNPACGTSRTVLGVLKEKCADLEIIEYLKTPPSRERMKALLKDMGMTPRDILRKRGTPYDELGLDNPDLTGEQILDALGRHPILMERPIVVTAKGTRLCRPADRLNELVG